jgi:hypothetical protein
MSHEQRRDALNSRSERRVLPPEWWATTETIAWRSRLSAWIEEQRTDVSECRAFSSPIPDADMPSSLPIGRVAPLPTTTTAMRMVDSGVDRHEREPTT